MKALKLIFGVVLLLGVLCAAAVIGGQVWLKNKIAEDGPLQTDTVLEIAEGETLSKLAPRLEAEGLISDERIMRVAARLDMIPTDIRRGEYAIPAGSSIDEIASILSDGQAILYQITIPEGLTTAQTLRRIEADEMLQGDMPETLPGEGELLPETYSFPRGHTRAELIAEMRADQAALIESLWPSRNLETIAVETPEEALILASIVQKEAAGPDEYANVASVFSNRLKRGMKLETDPTVIYGVSQGEPLFNSRGERRTLYQSELDRDTPYNTYLREGLPPTPIANPGEGAIRAVLNPPETEYLFFVADGQGGTVFTTNYSDHQRAVRAYRDYEREEIARERRE